MAGPDEDEDDDAETVIATRNQMMPGPWMAQPSQHPPVAPASGPGADTPPSRERPGAPEPAEGIPPFVFQFLLVSGVITALGLMALIWLML
jgi:hypothetical protein